MSRLKSCPPDLRSKVAIVASSSSSITFSSTHASRTLFVFKRSLNIFIVLGQFFFVIMVGYRTWSVHTAFVPVLSKGVFTILHS